MKITSYSFGGSVWRYQGFYVAFILAIIVFFLPIIEPGYSGLRIKFIAFILACIFWGLINLWLQPIVKINDEGLLIVRFGVIQRKLKWNNLKLCKKVRTITRYSLIGLDPRYSIIKIKDGTIFDQHIAILSFFKGYDEFIDIIEKNINSEDITTDEKYK